MMKLDRHLEAVGFASEALELDPTFAKARFNRAESYFQLKRYENAVEDLRQSFVDRPDLTDPAKMRVVFLYNLYVVSEYTNMVTQIDY